MQDESIETIFAVATGAGKAAVAIVRVSGPSCLMILQRLCPGTVFFDRRATLARLFNASNEFIDTGMVLYFPAPHSFTGEDVVEFQVTGGRAVVIALLEAIAELPATRPAEAGEFTRRSFHHGKRDLAQVEGLAAVVEAETKLQLQHAQRAASGLLSLECDDIKERILENMVTLEAILDFSDVEDVNNVQLSALFAAIKDLRVRTRSLLEGSAGVERIRDGLTVAIAGPPNAGKSSLINYLAGREVAIVSSLPGTTRDLIEVFIEIEGFPIVLVDTAGIREPTNAIEAEGIARALRLQQSADLTLLLSSCLDTEPPVDFGKGNVVIVKTKSDLLLSSRRSNDQILVSTKTGEGVDVLVKKISEFAHNQLAKTLNSSVTTQRQRAAIFDADRALDRLLSNDKAPVELLAEELRLAARAMSRVVGRIDVDDILGGIFSRLCIGK